MIQIKDLLFHYKKDKPVLRNINTNLGPGRIYGLLGVNGEGKTTFLKLIAGLIFPKEGAVCLNGLPTASRSYDFFKQIYMLPDQPVSPNLKIVDYVNLYGPFYPNFSRDFFEEALNAFNISGNAKIKSLSFGQQKKFHLAFALSTNTTFLLMDEPTNGLDIPSKTIVRRLLAKSITDDKTIIISTHLVKELEHLIDHLLILKNGALALDMHITDITNRYLFVESNIKSDQVLYAEQSLSHYRGILDNTKQIESNIDIELLFNAVLNAKL